MNQSDIDRIKTYCAGMKEGKFHCRHQFNEDGPFDLPAAIAEIERLRRLCGEAEHIISVRYGGVLDQYAHQHDDWEKDIIKQLQSSKPL